MASDATKVLSQAQSVRTQQDADALSAEVAALKRDMPAFADMLKHVAGNSRGHMATGALSSDHPYRGLAQKTDATTVKSDADLWEQKVDEGMSPQLATLFVKARKGKK
jgi:hypothetical protein